MNTAKMVLGGGCFWCVEAVFLNVEGVISVLPGYCGGTIKYPTYEAVCSGNTGHAEVVQIEYDVGQTKPEILLRWFWKAHDPTQLNRQGADIGTQYRSAIFYTSTDEKEFFEQEIKKEQLSRTERIVTEVSRLDIFWEAEAYHKNYFNKHPSNAYCQSVIKPKLIKAGIQTRRII